MKSKVLVLGLVFSLLVCSGNLVAKERRGAEVIVQKKDGQTAKGELIAVKPASLLLLDSNLSTDISLAIDDTKDITIVKKSKALLGAGLGLAVGVVAGLIIGGTEETIEGSREEAMAMYAGAIGGAAALLGGIIGAALGIDKTIQIEGRSPEEIKVDMQKLRGQARVTDFQ